MLDFSAVVGVDATATRSCFLMLVQLMRSADVAVVFANMTHSLEALFRAHKVRRTVYFDRQHKISNYDCALCGAKLVRRSVFFVLIVGVL